MFAPKSSHKRRRASARADAARLQKRHPARVVLNVAGIPRAFSRTDSDGHGEEERGSWSRRGSTFDPKGKQKMRARAVKHADRDAERRMAGVVRAHCFNHRLEILIPHTQAESAAAPHPAVNHLLSHIRSIAHTSRSCTSYATVPLTLFLRPDFVSHYVRSRRLVALSVSTGAPAGDDVVCLDGQGILTLYLSKSTYQTLGLTGRPARLAPTSSGRGGDRTLGKATRYIVEVPLLDRTFVPGKPGWERVRERFAWWEGERAWEAAARGEARDGQRAGWWNILFAISPYLGGGGGGGEQSARPPRIDFPPDLVSPSCVDVLPPQIQAETIEDLWVPYMGVPMRRGDANAEPRGSGSAKGRRPTDADDAVYMDYPETGTPFSRLSRGWAEAEAEAPPTPTPTPQRLDWPTWSATVLELAEWAALASFGAESTKTFYRPSPLGLNSYAVPEPRVAGSLTRVTISGFLHSESVLAVLQACTAWLDGGDAGEPQGRQAQGSQASQATRAPQASHAPRWLLTHCTPFPSSPLRFRSAKPGLGLALGRGVPRKRRGPDAGDGAGAGAGEDSGSDSGSSSSSSSSEDDEDEDDEDSEGPHPHPQKTQRTARKRRRATRSRGRGQVLRGEAEHAPSPSEPFLSHSQGEGWGGGEFTRAGWGMVLFGRDRGSGRVPGEGESEGAEGEEGVEQGEGEDDAGAGADAQGQAHARVIWWEDVAGDLRS